MSGGRAHYADMALKPHQRLGAWRAATGLSLTEAADRLKVAGPTWHSWERDENTPQGGYRDALEILTGIPAGEWMPERERAAIEAARATVARLDEESRGAS